MSFTSYVCAFRGRRDSYQVPVALAEAARLERFITDFYCGPLLAKLLSIAPGKMSAKLAARHQSSIPFGKVSRNLGALAQEALVVARGGGTIARNDALDRSYSLAAARMARKFKSNLLLYTPYAWEAFTGSLPMSARRVMFQYHPHIETELKLLANDHADGVPGQVPAHLANLPEKLLRRRRDAWQNADLIVCASSFTKISLVDAGCDPERCVVIPYGIPQPPRVDFFDESESIQSGFFRSLFVGAGTRRKGLHHLLSAWRNADIKDGQLVLVCRVIEPELLRIAMEIPSVVIYRGVSAGKLAMLYRTSDLFVMPSLLEGFGQVYLEALAMGCPVLGTSNTVLPDIGGEAEGVFIVPQGDRPALVAKLVDLAFQLRNDRSVRMSAARATERFTWKRFRKDLNLAI